MSELQVIEQTLIKARRRRRWDALWRGLWSGLMVGGAVWVTVLAVYKLLPLPAWSILAGAGAAGLVVLGVMLAYLSRRISLIETARWVDDRQQLQERLSTAMELSANTPGNEWQQLIVSDAAQHAKVLDTRHLLPLRFPRIGRWAVLLLLISAGLGFVPAYRSNDFKRREQDKGNIQETGKKLADLIRHKLQERPPLLETTESAMETVAELGDKLGRASLSRAEALRDLASLTDKISQQAKELADSPSLKALEKAARQPGGSGGASPQSLQKELDALQKALGKAAGQEDQMDELQKKIEQMKKSGGSLPDKDSPAGAEARSEMAKALAEMAQQAREMGASLPGLEEAIAALQADKSDLFLRDLDAALKDLDKMKQMAQAMQELQQQVARLGKDLAEQLEKGQADAAQQTLGKMIEQLQAPGLNQEQLNKLVSEASKAIDPGSEYGQVGQHLKKAAQQLKQGEKTDASESLTAAAQELAKLAQQASDNEDLADALEALSRAQMAISSGKTWSQAKAGDCGFCQGAGCAHCRGGRPSWSRGGKPGSGVGTWADENGWTTFEESLERYDNSGVNRPEMDPRGVSDRGEGDLNPNLLPDKVRGQMSPGGSMPSVTLKGVSIRGQSTVAFEERVKAAQTDAQSALNQDQVPRPYQNAVRNYFDDLKK